MALEARNGGGMNLHWDLAQHKSPLDHKGSLSPGNMVPRHHQECTNRGSLVGWSGLFLAKLRSKSTRYANIIPQLSLVI